ncbi:MAG: hypothetical protein CMJ94_12030 [Planctomycetes bacterium]|nr:hypothetical protein [Planctomycetota bacterium]
MAEERFQTLHPDPGKQGENIVKWKYEAVRAALLQQIPDQGEGALFSELPDGVRKALSPKQLDELGSVSWYVTTVKLDLEARGEIRRVSGRGPQRLLRNGD